MIKPFNSIHPKIHETAFIADDAIVIGDVEIGEDASVWFGSIIRGDMNFIRIGARTNIQDATVIHVSSKTHSTVLEENITVGHRVVLHGCHVETGCLIGIGAILMDAGLLSAEDAEQILRLQRQNNLRFGEAAIRLGLLTEADIQYALARQFDYAYLRMSDRRAVSEEVVAAYQPFSAQTEQMRAIRGQLMLRWFDLSEQRQTLAVIGSQRGEGRSWLAANLAVVFAQLGERTLLIDADMRNPRQHELFMLQNKSGLSTLLAHRSREEAIVRITDLVGLSVLPAGPVPPNPSELLNRPAFEELLAHARSSYDVVLIDTPSLSAGDDAAMIAVRAGAVVALARSRQTRVAAFNDIVAGLSSAGVAVVGSVLNDVPLGKRVGK